MPTYALMGATGATGSAVLRCLLTEPPSDLKLNILVRSKQKLKKAFPELEETTALTANIIEGTSTDKAVLQRCLDHAEVVFMCVAENTSRPGLSLSSDTATAIIDALKALKQAQGEKYEPATVIQLRTASLNPPLAAQVPKILNLFIKWCLHYIYADVMRACCLYQNAALEMPGMLDWILVDPPTIHDAFGTQRTGYELILTEKQETALSYADLGAAFCELAARRKQFRRKAVGVSATGKVNETWGTLLGYLVDGAKNRVWGLLGIM